MLFHIFILLKQSFFSKNFVYVCVFKCACLVVYESRVNVDLLWQSEEDLPSGRGYKEGLPSVLSFPQTYIKWHYTMAVERTEHTDP